MDEEYDAFIISRAKMGTKLLPQYGQICAFKPTSLTASFCDSNEIRRLFVKSGNSLRGKLHGFKPQRNEADKSGKKERPRHARRVGQMRQVSLERDSNIALSGLRLRTKNIHLGHITL